MKYLDKKMQFPMPSKRFTISHARAKEVLTEKSSSDCDHLGTKKVYVHGFWECERCGKPDTK